MFNEKTYNNLGLTACDKKFIEWGDHQDTFTPPRPSVSFTSCACRVVPYIRIQIHSPSSFLPHPKNSATILEAGESPFESRCARLLEIPHHLIRLSTKYSSHARSPSPTSHPPPPSRRRRSEQNTLEHCTQHTSQTRQPLPPPQITKRIHGTGRLSFTPSVKTCPTYPQRPSE